MRSPNWIVCAAISLAGGTTNGFRKLVDHTVLPCAFGINGQADGRTDRPPVSRSSAFLGCHRVIPPLQPRRRVFLGASQPRAMRVRGGGRPNPRNNAVKE